MSLLRYSTTLVPLCAMPNCRLLQVCGCCKLPQPLGLQQHTPRRQWQWLLLVLPGA